MARWRDVALMAVFNVLLIACAYVAVPLPFSPVPVTGQTFGVLVIAMVLGRVRGTAVVAAYVTEGALACRSLPAVPVAFQFFLVPPVATCSGLSLRRLCWAGWRSRGGIGAWHGASLPCW